MSAHLAIQIAIRARLIGTPAVTNLVPATSILDRHARPAPDPSIIIGEGQSFDGEDIARKSQTVVIDLHIWKKEPSLAGVKAIAGVIRTALYSARLVVAAPYHCGDARILQTRFMRDPDGETSHGIVTVEAVVKEA